MSAADYPTLGSCCMCRSHQGVRTIILLPWKGVPGKGWGCVVCGLGLEGAYAVLCDGCTPLYASGADKLRFACQGYAGDGGRVPIAELTEPHKHARNCG